MKLWNIKLLDNEGVVFSGAGFLSEQDAKEYVEKNPCNEGQRWEITSEEGIKLDADRHEFFKFFNLPEKEITEDVRFSLESLFCGQWYENPPTVINGKTYENWDSYTISYYCDQWWACGLNKGVKINGEYYLKEIARGEGDSQIDALCSLVILKHDLLEEESLTWMKEVFNG